MTRNQYEKKVRHLQRNLNRYAKENGLRRSRTADRVMTPNWGSVIVAGKHEGEILRSYEQCWEMMAEFLKGTPAFNGID
jgi:hypothetical protein